MPKNERKQLIRPETPEQFSALLGLAENIRFDLDDLEKREASLSEVAYRSQLRERTSPLEGMHPDLPFLVVLLKSSALRRQIHGRNKAIKTEGISVAEETPLAVVGGYAGSLVLIASGTQRKTTGFIDGLEVVVLPGEDKGAVLRNVAEVYPQITQLDMVDPQ